MADWYVSSTKFAAVTAFQASHLYSVGDFLKATSPASGREYVFRCTTGGTSSTEPSWSTAYSDGATVTSGGATFTNVSDQSTYGWSAAAGTLFCISNSAINRVSAGDRVFLSSDHSESLSGGLLYGFNGGTNSFSLIQVLSVNKAGSVPPVSGDLTAGAAIGSSNSNVQVDAITPTYWYGITFNPGSTAPFYISTSNGERTHYFSNCTITLTGSGARINQNGSQPVKVVFDNTAVSFNNTNQSIVGAAFMDLTWINTSSPIIGATLPTSIFTGTGINFMLVTARGVDFSAQTSGNIFTISTGLQSACKLLFDSCKFNSGATLYNPTVTTGNATEIDEVEVVNCWNGSNVINERHNIAGDVTTETTITLSGGATDDVNTNYSFKMVSNARADKWVFPLECFTFDVENTVTGSSKTATVEIISSGTLNTDDISLQLEYMGTSGNPIASFGTTLPTNILASGSAITSSSATWNSSPSTPQKQKLQVTFTPQRAGRIRGTVKLGKASTTVYVNPQISIA